MIYYCDGKQGYCDHAEDCHAGCQFYNGNGGYFAMTNGDHIRAMPDDKLAAALISADFCEVCDHYKDGLCEAFKLAEMHGEPLNNYCMDACLKWLQQPVKEE